MARIGGVILIVGLLAAVGWVARHDSAADKAGAEITGEWVVAHQAELRRALNLPGFVELEFKEVGQSSAPDYRLLKFELVAGERRRPLQLYVSHDGRRLLYDRVYELRDPFRAHRPVEARRARARRLGARRWPGRSGVQDVSRKARDPGGRAARRCRRRCPKS